MRSLILSCAFVVLSALGGSAWAQNGADAPKGTVEHIKVHGASLEGNLEGNSADRDVYVYLPPSYASDSSHRYPVVYDLHGYTLSAQRWVGILDWPTVPDEAIASAASREMILVAPDALTVHNGSMYSSSVTTGDWEGFIAYDLVSFIDSHYRTIPDRRSRGLSGHSMGGYGTVRIGMKHADVYSSLYSMSACCLSPRTADGPGPAEAEQLINVEEAAAAGFGVRGTLAAAAAWSPNPDNPPFYVNLPTKDGRVQPMVIAQWAANSPLAMLAQYVSSLKAFTAIAIDVGLQDPLLNDSESLDRMLTMYAVPHSFETYEGDHTNRVRERFQMKVLPFFSNELSFER